MTPQPRPLWNPYLAGLVLGLGLLLTFVLTGHGLGASGFTTALAASASKTLAPSATAANAYFGPMTASHNPLDSWITWEVIGLALGALASAVFAGRFRLSLDGPSRLPRARRLALALVGGAVSGFGARVSLGCTSGLGLSGSAVLATAGFLFLIGFFGAGVGIGLLMKRYWQ
ncbi:MAG: YeeE/YedE thiosulfate transporter family protein [Sinobacteraceae bacterium]|nr:YeeE/YedE family protein [Nevskia sp.]MDI3259528.1 YeeE/YedE thiosulfate transporter family protein [Nevskiaceae bacterium]